MNTNAPATDISSILGRLLLAVLVAAAVVAGGLWLKESGTLSFFATFTSVMISSVVASYARGRRIGPPIAVVRRFQGIADVAGKVPYLRWVGGYGFWITIEALITATVVATIEALIAYVLFSRVVMEPLARSSIALALALLPTYGVLSWWRSRNRYEGSQWFGELVTAVRQAITGDPEATLVLHRWVKIAVSTVSRTAFTIVGRVIVQVGLPFIFSTPLSIVFVFLVVIAAVAGIPTWAAGVAALKRVTVGALTSPVDNSTPAAEEDAR